MRTVNYLAVLALVYAIPGHAIDLLVENPAWTSTLDSTLTYSTQYRLFDQTKELATDGNRNDANNNFNKGFVLNNFRILSEFQAQYDADNGNSYGFFTRGTAYYDYNVKSKNSDNKTAGIVTTASPRGNITRTFFDDANSSKTYGGSVLNGKFHDDTIDRVGFGAELLDFMFYTNFATNSKHPVTLRVGKQIINWGESAFIQNGISAAINYADINKSTLPGVEVKEILRPLGALFGSVGLTSNLTASAYYQFEWEENVVPAYGAQLTSAPDFLSEDGGENILIPMDLLADFLFFRADLGINNPDLMSLSHVAINKVKSEIASDSGQWGVALNLFAPGLGDTEFGFYALNYHRKLPDLVVNNRGGQVMTDVAGINPATGTAFTSFTDDCLRWGAIDATEIQDCGALGLVSDAIDAGTYHLRYFEDVKLYGFSWNSVIPVIETAWSGEISLHHDIPVQTVEAFTGLLDDTIIACSLLGNEPCETQLSTREDVMVVQMTFTQLLSNALTADSIFIIFEAGWMHAFDLNDGQLNTPFVKDPDFVDAAGRRLGDYLGSGFTPVPGRPESDPPGNSSQRIDRSHPENRGTVWLGSTPATTDSWGYQFLVQSTWFDLIGRLIPPLTGTDLLVDISFRQDVNGTSVIPGSGFSEGEKAVSIAVEGLWHNSVSVRLAYANFFGNSTNTFGTPISKHPLDDRDFLALSLSYRF